MTARWKRLVGVAGLAAAALCVVLAGLVGCKDITFNGDMKGFLEYWSGTVQMGRVDITNVTLQKNDAGVDTLPLSATATITGYIINPKQYDIVDEVGGAGDLQKSVRVSNPDVKNLVRIAASDPTMLAVSLDPASGTVEEHTVFTVSFVPVRSETGVGAPVSMAVTLQYNTPPAVPTPVVMNYGTGQYEIVQAGQKWETDRDGYVYWAWDDGVADKKDPRHAEWFDINGTRHAVSGASKITSLSDGRSVFRFDANYGSAVIAAVDCEGVSGPAVRSGETAPPATYVIQYNPNGATSGSVPATHNKTQYKDVALADNSGSLARTGYTFAGWNTSADGGGDSYQEGSTYTADASVTLYAQWKANTYTVVFNANGGAGSMASQQFTYDQTQSLTTNNNQFTFSGFTFAGWRGSDGKDYTDGQSVSNLTADPNGTVTLYAKWGKADFVEVRGGTVTAAIPGSTRVFTGGTVTLKSFWISDHEVTQKEWHDVMGRWPAWKSPTASWGQGDNVPVYCVGWYEALVYCNKRSMMEGLAPVYSIKGSTNPDDWGQVPTSIDPDWSAVTVNDANGYRLPTMEEWVYAAAGGDPAQPDWSYTYAGGNVLDEVAWYKENSGGRWALEVKQKKPNRLGLYDMSGNVIEWCWDAANDSAKRRMRGGGIATSSSDDTALRLSGDNKISEIILNSNTVVGLRVVRSQ